MKKLIFILSITVLVGVLASCEKDDCVPIPQEEVQMEESEARLKSASYSYDGDDAASYALSHTNSSGMTISRTNYNNLYLDWADDLADCANFVSQCLKEGGFAHKYPYSYSTSLYAWWYCQGASTNVYPSDRADDYTSKSWVKADYLRKFLILTYGVSRSTLYSLSGYSSWKTGLNKGDLIFFDNYGDGVSNHVMIVTYVSSNTVRVSGHTSNDYNINLQDVVDNYYNNVSSNCEITKVIL